MENIKDGNDTEVCGFFDEVIDWDEIVDIKYIGIEETIDINTTGDRLFWANDILTHNSAVDASNAGGHFDHSHIAGGISKINTADNVFAIYTNAAMRERGEYQLHMLKTRSSSSVGQSIILKYNPVTMLISDHPDEDSVDVAPMTQADLQQKMKSALAKPSLGTVKAAPIVDDDTGEISNPPSQDPPKQDLAPADIRLKMLSMMSRVQNR